MFHGFAALSTLALLLVPAVPAAASGNTTRFVESTSGDLFVVDDRKRLHVVPDQIIDSDLACFNIWSEISGRVPVHPAQTAWIVAASGGALYLVPSGNAWPLAPDSISNSTVASPSLIADTDGQIPAPATPVSGQNKTPPPTALVGRWGITMPTDAGNASWTGESYVLH